MQNHYGKVEWTVDDVQTLAPSLSDEAAKIWLQNNAKRIQERLTDLGWEVIECLLRCDNIPIESDEDEE